MISLRFPKELEEKLDEIAYFENKTKTDILKESFLEYIKNKENRSNPYELGKKYIGKYESGIDYKSTNHRDLIRNKLKSKKNA